MRKPEFFPDVSSQNYCWVIVFAGFLGLFACLGLGRFSLGMMLPGMGKGLSLNYAQMGIISTINFCGYLGAVLFCGWGSRKFGARLLIFMALLLVGSSMMLVGISSNLIVIATLYCLTGVGSAFANVPMMALITTWFEPERRGRAVGLCVMGNGLGIFISARIVPLLSNTEYSWRMSWLVLGAIVLIISIICLLLIRNNRGEHTAKAVHQSKDKLIPGSNLLSGNSKRLILHSALIYFLFGFTYVMYITFMVSSLVEERGLSEQAAGSIWSLAGFISLISGPLFGYISDRWGRKQTLMLVFAVQGGSYFLLAMKWPLFSVYLSAILFGVVAFSIPTIIAALVGDYVGAKGAAGAFGFVTFVFGVGQIAGPSIAGGLAEFTGSFSPAFLLAALLTFTAVIFSALLPKKN